MSSLGNCWPTPLQQLLLQAALLPNQEALGAWNEYCGLIDLQNIDHVSGSLLPLVYHNLKQSQINHLKICKGAYRHTWSHNSLQFFFLKKTLALFEKASIIPCLLKGAALLTGYYKDPGLRVLGDIDILVSRHEAKKSMELLFKEGWVCKNYIEGNHLYRNNLKNRDFGKKAPQNFNSERTTIAERQGVSENQNSEAKPMPPKTDSSDCFGIDRLIQRTHAMLFTHPEGYSLDLHWTPLSESGIDPLAAQYTYHTHPIDSPFHVNTTVFSDEDQLFHTLFHGLKYSPQPLIRWVPDAVFILKQTPYFEWGYFLLQTKKMRLELPIYKALDYLQTHFSIKMPPAVIEAIAQYKPTWKEKRHFQFAMQKPKKFLFIFQLYWYSHLRNSKSNRWIILLLTLPSFVKRVQKITSFHQFVFFVLRGIYIHSGIQRFFLFISFF